MTPILMPATISHGANRVSAGQNPAQGDSILLPRGWQSDGSRRGIMYCHAAGQYAYHVTTWAVPLALASYFPLVTIDAGNPASQSGTTSGPYNWGNDSAIARYTDAYNYLTGTLGAKAGKIGIFAGSMGAAQALNWTRQNPTKVACVGLNIPVLDLNDIYVNNKGPGTYQGNIGAAYGVTYPAALPTLSTHSPVAYAPGDLNGIPIHVWASDDDPIAANTAAARTWAASGVGDSIVVDSTGAQGHNTTNLDPVVVFEWMKQYLG